MFQTGSQINPALGRIDYTPYMQGAVAGAQSIGQGIANLGQSIGSGIEQYYKKKEQKQQKQQATALVGNLIKNNEQIASMFGLQKDASGQFDPKAIEAGVDAVGAPAILNIANNLQMIEQQRLQEQDLRQQQIKTNSALNDLISKNYDPNTGKVNVSAVYQGAAKFGVSPEGIAKTLETLAKYNEAGIVKPKAITYATDKEARAAGEAANPGMPIKVEPAASGGFTFNAVLPAQSDADVAKLAATAEADSAQILYKTLSPQVEKFAQHKEAISDYDAAIKEVEEGKAFSGAGAQFKVIGAKAVQLLGGTQFDSQLAAYAALSTILANRTLTAGQMLKGSMSNSDRAFLQDMAGGKTPTVADLKQIRQIYVDMVSKKEPVIRGNIDSNFADFTSPQAKAYKKSLYITGGFEDGSSSSTQQPNAQSLLSPETLKAAEQELARRRAAGE